MNPKKMAEMTEDKVVALAKTPEIDVTTEHGIVFAVTLAEAALRIKPA